MFQIVAGLLWTAGVSFMIYSVNQPGAIQGSTDINIINIFLGFMLLLGLACFLFGIHSIVINRKTNKYGKKGLAVLVGVERTWTSVSENSMNSVDEYDAIFLVLEENNECRKYRIDVGTSGSSLKLGEYYDVLYYKDNINIVSHLHKNDIPREKLQILENAQKSK